jgi:hypothetical protein
MLMPDNPPSSQTVAPRAGTHPVGTAPSEAAAPAISSSLRRVIFNVAPFVIEFER